MNAYVKVLFLLFSSFIIIKFLLSYTYSLEQHDIEKTSNNPPSTDGVTDAEQYDHLLRKIPRLSKEVHGGGGMTAKHHQKPLCVSANTTYVRPLECANLDTYCGDWKRKKWHPQGDWVFCYNNCCDLDIYCINHDANDDDDDDDDDDDCEDVIMTMNMLIMHDDDKEELEYNQDLIQSYKYMYAYMYYLSYWQLILLIFILGCRYRDFTSAEARQCMGNHTLGFIGDSMIRNFGLSVGLFLSDRVDFGDVDNELSMDKVVEKEVCVWYTMLFIVMEMMTVMIMLMVMTITVMIIMIMIAMIVLQ